MSVQENEDGLPIIPLFYSEKIAEWFLSKEPGADKFCVRGVTQYQLRRLLALEALGHPQFAVFYLPIIPQDEQLPCIVFESNQIAELYLRKS